MAALYIYIYIFDTLSLHSAAISFERFEPSEEKEPLQT